MTSQSRIGQSLGQPDKRLFHRASRSDCNPIIGTLTNNAMFPGIAVGIEEDQLHPNNDPRQYIRHWHTFFGKSNSQRARVKQFFIRTINEQCRNKNPQAKIANTTSYLRVLATNMSPITDNTTDISFVYALLMTQKHIILQFVICVLTP